MTVLVMNMMYSKTKQGFFNVLQAIRHGSLSATAKQLLLLPVGCPLPAAAASVAPSCILDVRVDMMM